jgi:acetoacetate decarboxylase
MGFVKAFEQTMSNACATLDFYDAEMLTVFWETKPEIIARLLPPPLKPASSPVAYAFVASYPRTNFDVIYKETALFIRASFNGEEGGYCLAMPVTSDMALIYGREIFGFPKKMADINYKKTGDKVVGWTKRRGTRFMKISARLNGRFNDPAMQDVIAAHPVNADGSSTITTYNFKYFPAPEGCAFDYDPRLVKQETQFRPKEMLFGEAKIVFKPSDYDPWAEVEVVKMLGAIYTRGDNSMISGKVVADVEQTKFAPYALLKTDMF